MPGANGARFRHEVQSVVDLVGGECAHDMFSIGMSCSWWAFAAALLHCMLVFGMPRCIAQ